MATATVEFPWLTGLTLTCRLVKRDDDITVLNSATCVEKTNAKGVYAATFSNPTAGDYFLLALSGGNPISGAIGCVFNLTNTADTFYEIDLLEPASSGGTLTEGDIDNITDSVVAGMQAIPGFSVEVVQPIDEDGEITVKQGDAYLVADSRHVPIAITGSLPLLEEACSLKVFFGGTTITYTGDIVVNSATSYTARIPFTGTETAAMPAGRYTYELETTFDGTTNKWTPQSGTFVVLPQV
jgi:hypothetical protein